MRVWLLCLIFLGNFLGTHFPGTFKAFASEADQKFEFVKRELKLLSALSSQEGQNKINKLPAPQIEMAQKQFRRRLYSLAAVVKQMNFEAPPSDPTWEFTVARLNLMIGVANSKPVFQDHSGRPRFFPCLHDQEALLLQSPTKQESPGGQIHFVNWGQDSKTIGTFKNDKNFLWDVHRYYESKGFKAVKNYELSSPQNAADPKFKEQRKTLAANEIPTEILQLIKNTQQLILTDTYLAQRNAAQEEARKKGKTHPPAQWDSFQLLLKEANSIQRAEIATAMLSGGKWNLMEILSSMRELPNPQVKKPRKEALELPALMRKIMSQKPSEALFFERQMQLFEAPLLGLNLCTWIFE